MMKRRLSGVKREVLQYGSLLVMLWSLGKILGCI
jgi:hypothetical protein